MRKIPSLVLSVLMCGALCAAPPEVPAVVSAVPGQPVRVVVKAGADLGYKATFSDTDAFFDKLVAKDGQRRFMFQTSTPGTYFVTFWTRGETDGVACKIVVGGPAPPQPPSPGPINPIDPPAPGPVTSFHVILVTGDMITPDQRGVVYGKDVENWLNTNAKGNWRRRDKDAEGDADPTFAALWAAVKPKITTTPCIVIERNGKADILNLETTPVAQINRLDSYRK